MSVMPIVPRAFDCNDPNSSNDYESNSNTNYNLLVDLKISKWKACKGAAAVDYIQVVDSITENYVLILSMYKKNI